MVGAIVPFRPTATSRSPLPTLGLCLATAAGLAALSLLKAGPAYAAADAGPTIVDPAAIADAFQENGTAVPAKAAGPNVDEQDRKALEALKKEVADLAKTDPKAAATKVNQFLADRPALMPQTAIDAIATMAWIEYDGLKDPDKAMQMDEWGLKKYAEYSGCARLYGEEARVLAAEKRVPDAEALLKLHLTQIMQGRDTMGTMEIYAGLLEQDGNTDGLLTTLSQFMVAQPFFLNPDDKWWDLGYVRITNTLLKAKRPAEALSWAKLAFMECGYDARRVQRASRLLGSVWRADETAKAGMDGFLAAQKDPTLANPLALVPLPQVDPALMKDATGRIRGNTGLVSLFILSGSPKDAMWAVRGLNDSPAVLATEACRVFKATDLNLKRANEFLQATQPGQGEAMIDKFLAEQAAKDAKH